jgi:hypothetical protein
MKLTLPRFLVATSWFLCGALFWVALKRPWGVPGFYVAAIVGGIVGMFLTWAVLWGRLLLLFPLPLCRQGKCRSIGRDYVWRLGTIYGFEGEGVYRYKCACGDQYVRQGKKFMELLGNGTTRPYKRLVGFRHWADDVDP